MMKEIFRRWNLFLTETKTGSRKEVLSLLSADIELDINIDKPKGSYKSFGGKKENKVKLPFDYGEWTKIINTSDNMGWDFVIVPSRSTGEGGERKEKLIPLGHIRYKTDKETWEKVGKEMPENMSGNTKIIVSPDGVVTKQDRRDINSFFDNLIQFNEVVWY